MGPDPVVGRDEDGRLVYRETPYRNPDGSIKEGVTQGYSYVAVLLKVGDESRRSPRKLLTFHPGNCGHATTICTDCAHTWEIDYRVLYDQTKAGRDLKRMKEAQGK